MGLRVNLPEPGDAVVGVHLGCLQRGVAEEFLDLSHVGASVQQMGGERMAEYMGTFLTLYAAAVEFRSDDAVDGGPGYSFAFVS